MFPVWPSPLLYLRKDERNHLSQRGTFPVINSFIIFAIICAEWVPVWLLPNFGDMHPT